MFLSHSCSSLRKRSSDFQKIVNGFQRARAKAIFHWMTVDISVLGNQIQSKLQQSLYTN